MVASHPFLTAGLLVLACALAPRTAAAQGGPGPDLLAGPRAEFELGLALAAQQRWAEALAAFERSRATADRPSTAFNAALALQHLGRMVEARRALEQCLEMPAAASDPELTRAATEVLAGVRASIGSVTLTVDPALAELRVDGVAATLVGPSRVLDLDPDTHALNISAPGFVSQDLSLTLRPGARESRSVTLIPRPAHLAVVATPPDATVHVDGAASGRGMLRWEGPPGRLGVRVTAEGYRTAERAITLGPGESAQLDVALTREPRPLTSSPWLWVGVGAGVAAIATTVALVMIRVSAEPDPGTANRVLSGSP